MNFIHGFDSVVTHTKGAVALLEENLATFTPQQLRQHCTQDVHILIRSLPTLQSIMSAVQRQIRAVIELTGCHQINPILRRITRGATCSKTLDAMTWLFVGMWIINLLGFTMLSFRAGLFNSVIRAPRRKRQKEREKEFEEYKAYMAPFYEGTEQWQLDVEKKIVKDPDDIPRMSTFETEETSISAKSNKSDGSENACLASPLPKSDESANSRHSYEADYSSESDSEDERSNMSVSVLIGKIFKSRPSLGETPLQSPSVSTLTIFTRENQDKAAPSILDLQTPRRRRTNPLPTTYDLDVNGPESDTGPERSLASPQIGQTPRRRRKNPLSIPNYIVDSPASEDGSSGRLVSPQSGGRRTPQAPSKPKLTFYRTRGATKES